MSFESSDVNKWIQIPASYWEWARPEELDLENTFFWSQVQRNDETYAWSRTVKGAIWVLVHDENTESSEEVPLLYADYEKFRSKFGCYDSPSDEQEPNPVDAFEEEGAPRRVLLATPLGKRQIKEREEKIKERLAKKRRSSQPSGFGSRQPDLKESWVVLSGPAFPHHYRCKTCGATISQRGSGTSNLKSHTANCGKKMGRHHSQPTLAQAFSNSQVNKPRMFGSQVKDRASLLVRTVFCLVMKSLPFSLLEDSYFRELILEANPTATLTTPRTGKRILTLMAAFVRDAIHSNLTSISVERGQFLSLQFDIWTNNQTLPFGAVICTVLDDTWQLQSFCLGCDVFRERHTAIEIEAFISTCLEHNGIIAQDHVLGITVDGASSCRNAAHSLLPHPHLTHEHFLHHNILICIDHQLQRCIHYALGWDSTSSPKYQSTSSIRTLLDKARALVNSIRNSHIQQERLRALSVEVDDESFVPLRLSKDQATRWWSTYSMLTRLIDQRPGLDELFKQYGNSQDNPPSFSLNPQEWKRLCELEALLRPLKEVVQELEGDQYCTINLIYPFLLRLKSIYAEGSLFQFKVRSSDGSFTEKGASDMSIGENFCSAMTCEMHARFWDDPLQSLGYSDVASLLDPYFPLTTMPEDVLSMAWERLRSLASLHSGTLNQPLPADVPADTPSETSILDDAFETNSNAMAAPPAPPVTIELTRFKLLREEGSISSRNLPRRTRLLNWWRNMGSQRFPLLARTARVIFSATATEASCERVFSIAKRFGDNAPNLGEDTLDELVLIKTNSHIIEDNFTKLTQNVHEFFAPF